ncbi:MAG TPA: YiiX/YebB-like N1pC/P60 family cysteine hydrolase [Xanthobacteraceae bacterium]
MATSLNKPPAERTGPISCLASLICLLAVTPGWAIDNETVRSAERSHAACLSHQREAHSGTSLLERREAMAHEIERYEALVEEALGMRAEAIRFHRSLQAKAGNKEPLSGADLQMLREGTAALLAQRQTLLNVAESHECWTTRAPSKDPQEAAIQVAGVAMSLSAALVLYDNYLSAIAPYRNDHALRQLLNSSDKGFNLHAGRLNEVSQSFSSADNRLRVQRAVDWLNQHQQEAAAAPIPGYRYLQALIEQSPSLSMARQTNAVNEIVGGIGSLSDSAVDALFSLKDESTNFSSLLFGNTVGLVETRRGKLYRQASVAERVSNALKAADILVEKTPFRLTDAFIPGHWGHAAIWVGNEAELKALKIWDHPVVVPHQAAIRKGRGVVEALRSGVELNTLAHFLNIDDLGVLRQDSVSDEKRAAIILLALRQIGKPYDFNFDAETTNRVFCSKLVYLAYGDLQWPTSRVMGRVTVSPDNIAERSVGNGPLNVVLLYHDGQEVTEKQRDFMQKLLKPAALASR